MKNKSIMFFLAVTIIFCGCVQPNSGYVDASNDAFEVIVPQYQKYVDDDNSLKREDRDVMIRAAQEALLMSREEKKLLEKE